MGRKMVMLGTFLAAGALIAAPALAQEGSSGQTTITAKVAACYLGQDLEKPGELECANLCMERGAALVLVGETSTYVPVDADGEGASGVLMPFNDLTVDVMGTVAEGDGCPTIVIAQVEEDVPDVRTHLPSRVFASTLITADDLEGGGEMTLYHLLRQHARVRWELVPGIGEVPLCEERAAMEGERYTGCLVYVNDARASDPIGTLRDIRVHQVQRLEILRRSEASSRLGGYGYNGAILIRLKR